MGTTATKGKRKTPSSWDEKIAKLRARKPLEAHLVIPDEDALQDVDRAKLHLIEVRRAARRRNDGLKGEELRAAVDADPEVQEAEQGVRDAQESADEAGIDFHLRQLPPDVYDALPGDHQPTDEQADKGMLWNPDTYIPALISACSVEDLPVETVTILLYGEKDPETGEVTAPPVFNNGDAALLFATCRELNERARITLGKESRLTRD